MSAGIGAGFRLGVQRDQSSLEITSAPAESSVATSVMSPKSVVCFGLDLLRFEEFAAEGCVP